MGKADVNGDAAALLFFQAVGIDAGEGLYQRGLSVVDVPGGADDDGLHSGQYSSALQSVAPALPTRRVAGRLL